MKWLSRALVVAASCALSVGQGRLVSAQTGYEPAASDTRVEFTPFTVA
jgi:hypothetical protein